MDPLTTYAVRNASVGDVLTVVQTEPVPDGWLELDGKRRISYRWPEFVRAMRIQGSEFVLPKPTPVEHHRHIIKMR